MTLTTVAVLEVGGTHATAAVVTTDWVVQRRERLTLDGQAPAVELLARLVAAGDSLAVEAGLVWSIAVPGPFDYQSGIARYAGVGKFDSLAGLDVGAALRDQLLATPSRIIFLNDASAFGLGEWIAGAGRNSDRCVAITLGTGVGSAFLRGGRIVDTGDTVPPDGEVHLLRHQGRPLEQFVSRRAILRQYRQLTDGRWPDVDVREIADRARLGEASAAAAFTDSFRTLGEVLTPWLLRFDAQVLVVGGSMSKSWDLVGEALVEGLGSSCEAHVVAAQDAENSGLLGAAYYATS